MERITIFKRTSKKEGAVKLRFRLRDGRSIDLYHKSDITASLKSLDKFTDEGTPKPRVSLYDKNLLADISREMDAMRAAYSEMKERGLPMTGENFETCIDKILYPEKYIAKEEQSLLVRFTDYIEGQLRNGYIGEPRKRHYDVVRRELERFLIVSGKDGIIPNEFTTDVLQDFRLFLRDEYLYVKKWRGLYVGMNNKNIPTEMRSQNTISGKLKLLQAFFNDIENKEVAFKSPFRALGVQARKVVLHERYDDPVYLEKDEFLRLMATEVPESLQDTKDAFLLQCAFGCRIGDFLRLSMDKVSQRNGIPYIHYLPHKTLKTQSDYREIETPIMKYALEIIKRRRFVFPVLNYVYGSSGYNVKIKRLLMFAGIDRKCKIFDEEKNDNVYKPLWELGSSKLCRKTHVDLMNKVQVNQYAAGLHREGSDAVNRYTHLELADRFRLMCAAFGEPEYRVDKELNIIEEGD